MTVNREVSVRPGPLMRVPLTLQQEEYDVSGSKGAAAHFVWRCSLCKRVHSARFEDKSATIPYTADSNGQFAPFVTLDCRGLEFIGFEPSVRSG